MTPLENKNEGTGVADGRKGVWPTRKAEKGTKTFHSSDWNPPQVLKLGSAQEENGPRKTLRGEAYSHHEKEGEGKAIRKIYADMGAVTVRETITS